MPTATASRPNYVITAGPKVIRLAAPEAATVRVVPRGTFAPARKSHAADTYGAVIGAWVESEADTADAFITECKVEADKMGARIVAVISESAMAHEPSEQVYSQYVSPETILAGLRIIAAQVVTVA